MRIKARAGNKHTLAERRFLLVVVLACVLPLAGVAAYRALERGQPVPSMSATAAAPAVSLPAAPKFVEFTDKFRKKETITEALMRHGMTRQQVAELVQAARPVYSLKKVIADREFAGNLWPNGEFHELRYRIDDDRYITVYRDGNKFIPLMKRFDYEMQTEPVAAVIEESLFTAVAVAGEQAQLAVDLDAIFAWDVDFNTDIQKGDSFRVLLEKKYLNGKFVKYGQILAAELRVHNKLFSAFRFENEYYDEKGKALKKSFLKSPLQFVRISSRFSSARYHPILKIVRPHWGVDYAAPAGTPVVAVAAGKVLSAGWDGDLGKSVRLRHTDGSESIYSHLSRIEVQGGAQVAQGTVIGRVGATGLATGPHLDFRLRQGKKYVDPTRRIIPAAPPVAKALFARFAELRDGLRSRLDQVTRGGGNAIRAAGTNYAGGETWK